MQTQKIISELDEYLAANDYYTKANSEDEVENINTAINAMWQTEIEEALRADLRAMLSNDNLQVKQTRSIFDIISDEQVPLYSNHFLVYRIKMKQWT